MSDNANIDIRHLAHSLLNREQHPKAAPTAHMPELKKPPLAPHLIHHAHDYVEKIMKAKGLL